MRAPLPWFGGKQLLAERIVALLPEHRVYVEPCGGAAAVLCTKPRSHLEVYNDVDGDLVAFFRVLRDEPAELVRLLSLTPFSREEYVRCVTTYRELEPGLERTRRWYVAVGQSFAAGGSSSSWSGARLGGANQPTAKGWASRVQQLAGFAGRFQGVQVERLDWRSCLERYDAPAACFYLDPPYHPSTRLSGGYAHEWTEADHAELLERLHGLAGAVLLSGHRCPEYDTALVDWRRVDVEQVRRFGDATPRVATESIWLSPRADRQLRLELA